MTVAGSTSLTRQRVIVGFCLAVLGALIYSPSLSNEFVLDDIPAIVENPVVIGDSAWTRAFTDNFWAGRSGYEHVTTWRPLTSISFRLNYSLFGPSPWSFHAANMILHGLVTALVFVLLILWFQRLRVAILASGLFAVLPIHVEAVAGAVNRAELQAAMFYLLALSFWIAASRDLLRRSLGFVLAITCFVFALLSKEHAITWPAAVGVYEGYRWLTQQQNPNALQRPHGPPVWSFFAVSVLVVIYLVGRAVVLPSVLGGEIPAQDNPLVEFGLFERVLTVGKIFMKYVVLLVAPTQLSVDYSAHAIAVAQSFSDVEAVLGLVLLFAALATMVCVVRSQPEVAVGLALFLGLFALVGNVIFLNTIIMAERLMYLPSVGWCAVWGWVFGAMLWPSGRGRIAVIAFILVIASVYGVFTARQTMQWKNSESLFQSAVAATPNSARNQYNLGNTLLHQGQLAEALVHLSTADRILPGDSQVLNKLGDLYWRQRNPRQAIEYYRQSMKAQLNVAAITNLCRAYVVIDNAHTAIPHCAAAIGQRPNNVMAHHFMGLALYKVGNKDDAVDALRRALSLSPGDTLIKSDLARILGGK